MVLRLPLRALVLALPLLACKPTPPSAERLDDVVLTLRPADERQREVVVELSSAVAQALIQLATI